MTKIKVTNISENVLPASSGHGSPKRIDCQAPKDGGRTVYEMFSFLVWNDFL